MGKTDIFDILYLLGAVLMIGAIILFMEGVAWAFYSFCAGAVLYLAFHLKHAYRGDDFRLKRLNRLFGFNVILVAGSAYLMYIGNNSFVVLMLLAALLEFYLSWRSDRYSKDDDNR